MSFNLLNDFNTCPSELMAWLYFSLIIITGMMLGLIAYRLIDDDKGYRQGQIDAINGKVKYKKKVNDDKETGWVEITTHED